MVTFTEGGSEGGGFPALEIRKKSSKEEFFSKYNSKFFQRRWLRPRASYIQLIEYYTNSNALNTIAEEQSQSAIFFQSSLC